MARSAQCTQLAQGRAQHRQLRQQSRLAQFGDALEPLLHVGLTGIEQAGGIVFHLRQRAVERGLIRARQRGLRQFQLQRDRSQRGLTLRRAQQGGLRIHTPYRDQLSQQLRQTRITRAERFDFTLARDRQIGQLRGQLRKLRTQLRARIRRHRAQLDQLLRQGLAQCRQRRVIQPGQRTFGQRESLDRRRHIGVQVEPLAAHRQQELDLVQA